MINNFLKYDEKSIYERKSIWEQLEGWAIKYNERIALTDGKRHLSYKDLMLNSQYLAQVLLENGVRYGDNVAVQLPNVIGFFEICFALWKIGARPILLLPAHREAEIKSIIESTKATTYIFPEEFFGYKYYPMAQKIREEFLSLKILGCLNVESGVFNIIGDMEKDEICVKRKSEYKDIALFLLSGGTTTGVPKLIPKIHAAYMYNAKMSAERCKITKDTVFLELLPVAHDFPLCCPGALGTFYKGGKVVLAQTSSCDEAFELIENEKVTTFSLVPAIAEVWIEAIEMGLIGEFSSVKSIIIGASKLKRSVALKLIKNFHCVLQQGYGLGEGITCFTSWEDNEEIIIETQGRPISEFDEFKIVDEKGIELPSGECGELIERGPYTFEGYYRAENINKLCFTAEGFFRTGDRAKVTEEGNIIIEGRIYETINRGGEKILPSELEHYIGNYVGIKENSVFSFENDEGDVIIAVAIVSNKSIKVSDINHYLRKCGLAPYKMVDKILYVEEMPRINVGKIDKLELVRRIKNNEKRN